MKKSSLKFILIALVVGIGAVAISVYSCEKQEFTPNTADAVSNDPTKFITEPGAVCGDLIEKKIISKDGTALGNSVVYNDTKYFYVILTPQKGMYLRNCYLDIRESMADIPADANGNLLFKSFAYNITDDKPSTFRKFRIPLKEFKGYSFVSCSVDLVYGEEGPNRKIQGWIQGTNNVMDKEGQVFTYTKQLCTTKPGETDAADE